MIALTTAVAIAVTCSVIFMVSAVVITIIWIKIRQERRSLALIKARQGPYSHGLQNFPAETLTELSREEGSALRQYGQLPYGRPTEWGLLTSRESLAQTPDDKSPIELLKKRSLSLKRSLSSLSRGHSKRNLTGPGSLTTLTEASEGPYSQVYASREDLIVSAIDGIMELPTETTPRQTPEREDEQPGADNAIRPISGAWPLLQQRERSSVLFPVIEDRYETSDPAGTRVRGGSITSQTAGIAPDQPVPPPPCAYPPNRFRLSKNDSVRFSSVSLETADSSILDDSRRTSANVDSSLASPALPPCPTFAPFSANDVGKECNRRSLTANAAPFVFPANSPARKGQKIETERASPRRSLTACSPTRASERVSPTPRRSESLSAKESRDEPKPYLDMDRIPPLNTTGRNTALLPHFSQMQRHSMHGSPRRDNDPFYSGTGSSHSLTYNPHTSGRRASSFQPQDTTPHRSSSHPKPPLASALKGSGHRKGHRRQNCVRISIHPPITFGGPAFSPMVEEPEEVEEIDMRRSEILDISYSNVSPNSSLLAMSTINRNSVQEDLPISQTIEGPADSTLESTGSPVKKKRQAQPESASTPTSTSAPATTTMTVTEKALPGIVTSLPTATDKDSLSHTPSPERNPPVWKVPYQNSPTQLENSPVPGSPRRSAVMGPRSQPGKPARNSYQSLIPSEDGKPPPSHPQSQASSTVRPPRNHSIRESSRSPSAQYSLRRVKSEAREQTQQTPPRNQSRKRASHYTLSSTSRSTTTTSTQPSSQTQPQSQSQRQSQARRTPGTQIRAIVPIWEDRAQKQSLPQSQPQPRPRSQSQSEPALASVPRRPTVSLVYDPPVLNPVSTGTGTGAGTETGNENQNGETSPRRNQADRMACMSSYRSARQGYSTPAKKTVGLGIGAGAATPGSLYDGEGFLKE
ncbi:hypothetical protein BJX62DRAFT_208963 [Aspergillus germanicus]